MIKIRVIEETLSDGSLAYNVRIGDIVLPAVSEQDSYDLVDKLESAIRAHTNEQLDSSQWAIRQC